MKSKEKIENIFITIKTQLSTTYEIQ